MNDVSLYIAETFPSIQGEGQTAGIPAVFVRLSACNLFCGLSQQTFSQAKKENWTQDKIKKHKSAHASWVCDTHSVWMHGKKTPFDEILNEEYLNHLKNGAHLIITGGEPLLQQENIKQYIDYLHTKQIYPAIEIETNGTIQPSAALCSMVGYWNVSPKLSNSGMPEDKRINKQALSVLNNLNTIFKFVISKQSDWHEIVTDYIDGVGIDKHKIWLMPAADTREQLYENSVVVAEIAKNNCVNFSNRLQVQIWDRCTGV